MPGVGLDSSSQLDELLRELLNEVSSKDSKLWSKDGLNEDGSQNGSITTQSGNSRTIISWQTNPSGPRKAVTVTKHLADCYSGNEQWNTMNTGSKYSEEQSTSSYEKSEAHLATVKYTDAVDSVWKESRSATHGRPAKTPPPPPPVRRRLTSTNGLRMEMLGSSTEDKTQWERRDYSDTATKDLLGRNWASDSEDTRSWLDEQMWRLQTKKSGKSYQQHTRLERQLVADLKERLGLGGKELTQRGIEESSQRKTSSTSSSPPPLPPQRSKDSQSHVVSISFDDVTDLRSPSSSRAASNVVVNQTQSQNDLEVHHLQRTPTPSPKNRTSTGDDRTMSSSSLHAFRTAALDDETVTTIARSSTPMGRMEPPLKRSSSLKARASFYVSGIERPAFSTHQTKYTFSVNPVHLEDPEHTSRLPPVPPHRPGAPTSPVTPKRSDSSREAVLKSQRKLVCSQSPNELENSLRLIMEHKPQTHSSTPDRAAVDQRKVASTPARDLGDEVIVLKPIGPGIQALEPDNTGTLKKPMTSLISLSASSIVDQTLRKNPASPVWTSADNINSQQGHLNRQCQLNVQYSSMTAKKSQLPSNTATQVAQPFGVGNANAIATEQQQLWQQQTLPHQQQRQQYFQQSYAQQHPWQQHLVQQPLIAQQYVSLQPWQQQTQPWQQQSWQQQTWQQQQQQSRLLQQQLYASPGLSFSQNPEDVQMTAQTIEFAQQRGVRQRSNVAQHESQALSVGVPKNWPSDGGPLQQNNSCNTLWNQEPFVQNTHQDVQFNMLQHNLQKSQNLNTEQFGSQHLGSQTLNDQQMMSPSLWNTQLLGGQITHQSNTQPMGVYQSTPQFITNQEGLSAGVQQHERSKYVTVEASTLSQDGTLRPSGWQPQFDPSNICIPQQMQLTCVQNQGQLMQQQMHFQQQQQQQMLQQQNQQQQQQQLYSRTLHSSLEDQIQNRRQVDKSWMTLGNSVKSPAAPLGSPVAVGSWPSVGYSDNLQFQRTVTNPQSMSYETLLRTRPPSLLRAALPASIYSSQYRKGSLTSLTDEIEHANALPRFVRDTSEYWYKPNISREEAINMLKDKAPGSFIVRNSTMFQGGFGLALRVAQMPPNVQVKGDDLQANLVRHFLIESGSKGVRLKGCSNEPAFGSLAALIYQHAITSLALPCRLILPVADALDEADKSDANTLQSSVCNTMYVESIDTESLTGPEALSRAITVVFDCGRLTPKATAVQFKVSHEGITLTDSKHRLFFRRHYPLNTISFCGMDGIDRRLIFNGEENVVVCGKLFGFVARKSGNNSENASHLFLNPENNQSTSTIVDMVTKVMMGQG